MLILPLFVTKLSSAPIIPADFDPVISISLLFVNTPYSVTNAAVPVPDILTVPEFSTKISDWLPPIEFFCAIPALLFAVLITWFPLSIYIFDDKNSDRLYKSDVLSKSRFLSICSSIWPAL